MERYCPQDYKVQKYKTISVGGLWAEQFAIKVNRFYREFLNNRDFVIFSKIRDKAELIIYLVHRLHGFAGVGGRGIKNKNK